MFKNWIQYIMIITLFTVVGNEVNIIVHGILNQCIVTEDLHEDKDDLDKKLDKKKVFEEKFFCNHLQEKFKNIVSTTVKFSSIQSFWYTQPVIEKHVPPPNFS